MDSKNLKKWYYISGAIACVGTIMVLIRLIAGIVSTKVLAKGWDVFTWIAVAIIGVAILMLVGMIIFSYFKEKDQEKKVSTKSNDEELLKKYQKKNQ